MPNLEDLFAGKTVIVTGGTGSIGSEIVRQLLKTDVAQVRVFSRDEHKQYELKHALGNDPRLRYLLGDIRDAERLNYAFRGADICFHAAALKHVPFCEYNPFEATKTNIIGTQNVINSAIEHNLEKVIAISTDKVVNPISVLGASKLMMEKLITSAGGMTGPTQTLFSSVRFGNVLHSRGSVVELWRKQIEQGKPVTVTDRNATRFFMEIPEAVGLIFDAMKIMKGGEIFVLKMKRQKIIDYARTMIAEYGGGKKVSLSIIGKRPGDKMHEALLTSEELSRAIETQTLYIILPDRLGLELHPRTLSQYKGARKAKRNKIFVA